MSAWHQYKKLNDRGKEYLTEVVTITEACHCWGKRPSTIRYAIDSGRLAARRSPTIWLISTQSLLHLWGKPKVSIQY